MKFIFDIPHVSYLEYGHQALQSYLHSNKWPNSWASQNIVTSNSEAPPHLYDYVFTISFDNENSAFTIKFVRAFRT